MASIALTTSSDRGVTIVRISGSLDGTSVPLLLAQLEPVLEDSTPVVLDMSGVDYVSSAGWGMILTALTQTEERSARTALCRLRPTLIRTFDLLKLGSVLRHYLSDEEAVKSVTSNLTQ